MNFKSLLIISFLLIGNSLVAQNECSAYHRKKCDLGEGAIMKYDSQSKSATMGKGQTSEFHLVAYRNLDYRITICNQESLGDKIQFKIYEKERVLVKSNEEQDSNSEDSYEEYSDDTEELGSSEEKKYRMVKELLYDNASDSYINFLEFTAESTMSLIIELTVPGSGNESKLKVRETGCVGVLIEHEKSNPTGF